MGLLIGGSVLSLVEMLDFFFYNGFLELIRRYRLKKRNDAANKDHMDKYSIALESVGDKIV